MQLLGPVPELGLELRSELPMLVVGFPVVLRVDCFFDAGSAVAAPVEPREEGGSWLGPPAPQKMKQWPLASRMLPKI